MDDKSKSIPVKPGNSHPTDGKTSNENANHVTPGKTNQRSVITTTDTKNPPPKKG